MLDPTKRFSDRVENYLKYRPRYPTGIIRVLAEECGLTSESLIADVGSGTGLLSELFLKNGNRVIGIEPNPEMRAASRRVLADYSNFTSVEATAEATTLPKASVDFITVGQAFHWFDRTRARVEFERVLKPGGCVAITWNGFATLTSKTTAAFHEVVVRNSTDYHEAVHELVDSDLRAFFSPARFSKHMFANEQTFDFEALIGRVRSMSFAPRAGDPRYAALLRDLKQMFDTHQHQQKITIKYETPVYFGGLR